MIDITELVLDFNDLTSMKTIAEISSAGTGPVYMKVDGLMGPRFAPAFMKVDGLMGPRPVFMKVDGLMGPRTS